MASDHASSAERPPTLGQLGTDGPPQDDHDLLLVDLDGVVYLGDEPIPGAADALNGARNAGIGLVFVTNNAARPPSAVAQQLTEMGIAITAAEVMTSAVAAARRLADELAPGAAVLAIGGVGVADALAAAGLTPVRAATDQPVAIVQGFGSEVGWAALAEAAVAIRAGARWIATNSDATLPSPRGPLPGNGSLVAALETATGCRPEVIGKPQPALFAAALAAGHGERPLVIGDRLDTDIAGAVAAGLPSLLVLTGVSTALDLLGAPAEHRPTYLGRDLSALTSRHDEQSPDGLDRLRRLCRSAWTGELDPASYSSALASLDVDVR